MSARPKPFPEYPRKPRRHGGGARIKVDGREHYLGQHGSDESYREYERLRTEHARGCVQPKLQPGSRITIAEMVARWTAAEPRGADHHEVSRVVRACVPLIRLYGPTLADEFTATRLEALREAMIDQSWLTPDERARQQAGKGIERRFGRWSRGVINRAVDRIRRVFRWAERKELVPPGRWEHLKTLQSLPANDRRVKSHPKREPADWETQIKPAMAEMPPQVRAMVELQYLIGARPSEVLTMRRCEIDQTGDVWTYTPESHKNAWREQQLVKVIGPRGQIVLAPWLMAAEPEGFIFIPNRVRKNRCYTVPGYGRAVARACRRAKVKHFFPYQIRYAAERRAEEAGGLAGAAAHLGQRQLETTKRYAELQRINLAKEIARKIG